MPETAQVIYKRPDYTWNQLPFQANGAAIAIYATAITTLMSMDKLHKGLIYLVPIIGYLAGLIFSYITHSLHNSLLLDHDQRERLNGAMQFAEQVRTQPNLSDAEHQKIAGLEEHIKREREKLLPLPKVNGYVSQAAWYYATSMVLFLGSTMFVTVLFAVFLLT